jgi:hypothetical protein
MSAEALPPDMERLLRRALSPVDPPAELAVRVERTLEALTDLAADELEGWELSAMRDPRNWARPVAATVVGTTAGTALVLLRARQRSRRRKLAGVGALERAGHAVQDVAGEALKLLRRR